MNTMRAAAVLSSLLLGMLVAFGLAQTPPGASQPPLVKPSPKADQKKPGPIVPGATIEAGPTRPYLRNRIPLRDELATPTMREDTEAEEVAEALGLIGRAAVPSLIQVLQNRDPQVRRQAALVLARIGPDAEQAVPELIATLDDEDEGVRKAAARALGQVGPAAAEAVPALIRAMVQPTPVQPERPAR